MNDRKSVLDKECELDGIVEKLVFVSGSLQQEGYNENVGEHSGEDPRTMLWELRVSLRGAANIVKEAATQLNEIINWFTDNDIQIKAPAAPGEAETGASE